MATKERATREPPSRFPRVEILHLLCFCGLAFSAPLFSLLGAQAEFFVARRSSSWEVVGFALAVSLLPATLLALLEVLAGLLSARLRGWLHVGLVGLLATLAARVLLGLWLPLAPLLGIATAWAFQSWSQLPVYAARLATLTVLLPFGFLFLTPVSQLVMGPRGAIAPVEVRNPIPVVLLVFDELPLSSLLDPKLEVDARSFPNFRRLQADSLWFRNAAAVSDDTMRAVPALLTGRRAPRDRPPVHSNYPVNLFTLLRDSHRLAVSETMTSLAPLGSAETLDQSLEERWRVLAKDTVILYLHRLLPKSMTSGLPSIDHGWVDFANELARPPREQPFLSFLDRMTDDPDRPGLYYYHNNLPHYPYSFLPDGREYDAGSESAVDGLDAQWMWTSPWAALQAYQRHLLQAMFADHLLGVALDRLEQSGLYGRALLIVAADHGSSYRMGAPFRPAAPGSLPGVAPVPLFVKLPGGEHSKGIVDRPVTTMDILPTIVEVLGVQLSEPLEGQSLLAEQAASHGRQVTSDLLKTGESVPFPDDLRPLEQAVDYKTTLFGPHLENLFLVGPATSLVGKPLNAGGEAPFEASILWPALLDDVTPDDRFVPCRIRGFVAPGGPPMPLVVALNGTIVGSTWTVPAGKDLSGFSLMVDPSRLKPGRNQPTLARLARDQRLEQIPLRASQVYTLRGDQIVGEQGQPLALEPNLQGEVVSMTLEAGGFKVDGWAALGEGIPARALAVFQNGRFLLSTPTAPDGTFRISLPAPVLKGQEKPRLFAIGGRGARELVYKDNYRRRVELH